jgi:hypothetical protein
MEDCVEVARARAGLMVGPGIARGRGEVPGESEDRDRTVPEYSTIEGLANMLSR